MATKKIKSALCFEPFESELALLFACRIALNSRYFYIQGRAFRSGFNLPDEFEELFSKNNLINEGKSDDIHISEAKSLTNQILKQCDVSRAYNDFPISRRINLVADKLSLSKIEKEILLVIFLIQIDSALEQIISNAEKQFSLEKGCTLFSLILNQPKNVIRNALGKHSKLRTTQLLDIDSSGSNSFQHTFDLERSTSKMLLELDRPTEDFMDYHFGIINSKPLPIKAFKHLVGEQAIILSTLVNKDISSKNYLIYGQAGMGKTEFVRSIVKDIGYQLYEISATDEDGYVNNPIKRLASLCIAQSFLKDQEKVAILIDESEDIFGLLSEKSETRDRRRFSKAWFNSFIEQTTVPVFWVSNYIYDFDPAYQRRFTYTMPMPSLPKSRRKKLLKKELKDLPISEDLQKHLTKNPQITPALVNNLKEIIGSLSVYDDSNESMDEFAEKYLSDSFRTVESQYVNKTQKKKSPTKERFYKPEYTNCNYSIQSLTEKFNTHPGGRLFLYGPPGTGKTEYAHYLARKLGKKLLVRGPSDFLDMWVGGTEKNIANAFKEAKTKKAILLIDEVDTLLSNRDEVTRNWEVSQVNEMLTQIQNFEGILIATTNRLNALDPAIFRRFHFKVGFEYMTFEQSQKLLKHHLKGLNVKGRMTNNLNEKLQYCGNLTPGDFAVVSDRLRFLGCESIEQDIHELMEETKHRRSKNKSIGFSAIVQ